MIGILRHGEPWCGNDITNHYAFSLGAKSLYSVGVGDVGSQVFKSGPLGAPGKFDVSGRSVTLFGDDDVGGVGSFVI